MASANTPRGRQNGLLLSFVPVLADGKDPRLTAMDRTYLNIAADRERRERLEAERLSLKAEGVTRFFLCDGCDHYLPSRGGARGQRCWPCERKRQTAYQREYRAFRARAKAQGGQCPICKTSYAFSGRPLDYRRPCATKAGDMICYRCATVLSLVGDNRQTLLALVQYLSGVADWKSSAQQT
jgi:hypothetical protein